MWNYFQNPSFQPTVILEIQRQRNKQSRQSKHHPEGRLLSFDTDYPEYPARTTALNCLHPVFLAPAF
jgi:hypothetical protein